MYAASKWQCTAADRVVPVPRGGIHEWQKAEQGD